MSYTYALTSSTAPANNQQVIRSDGAAVPNDPGNADFVAYLAWLAAGNSPAPVAAPTAAQLSQAKYAAAIAAGLTVTWSSTTAANGTFQIDTSAQFNFTAEVVSISMDGNCTNGQSSRNWPTLAGNYVTLTTTLVKTLSIAVAAYVDALITAQQTEALGGTATWPSATVTLTG